MFYIRIYIVFVHIVLVYSAVFRQELLSHEVCETNECRSAAAHIKKWMNPDFKACEDFYEFSCGFWHNPGNTTEVNNHDTSLGSRTTLFNYHLKNFLLDDEIVKTSRLYQMLRRFLSLCLDEESIESRGVSPALEVLKELGGWPVLEQDWSEDKWNFLDAEIALGGSFFKIDVKPDPSWTLVVDFEFKPVSISIEDLTEGFQKESVTKYYERKCELAEAFGADRIKAEQEMRDSMEIDIALAKAKMISVWDFPYRYKLKDVQKDIPWMNWTQLVTAFLPDVPITENSTVLVKNPGSLGWIGKTIINVYSKRAFANYMMWKAAASLAEYLPRKIYNIVDPESINKTRQEMCFSIAANTSLSGVIIYYVANQSIDETKQAREITQNILDELLHNVSELDWLDNKTRTDVLKGLRNTRLSVSFPDELLDLDNLEASYEKIKFNISNFFQAALEGKQNLMYSLKNANFQIQLRQHMETAAYYHIQQNAIVVSPGFLNFLPLFSSKLPAYINYAQFGSVIAHELTHALDIQSNSQQPKNNLKKDPITDNLLFKWGSKDTEKIYYKKKQCIIKQYSAFNESKYTGEKLNGKRTQREDVADIGGLKLALQAYRKMASHLASPEPRLPTLQQYSPEQIFLISLANMYCEIPHKKELLQMLAIDIHSIFEFRVKGMMMNSPDFGELFECATSDPMNPENKCEVW